VNELGFALLMLSSRSLDQLTRSGEVQMWIEGLAAPKFSFLRSVAVITQLPSCSRKRNGSRIPFVPSVGTRIGALSLRAVHSSASLLTARCTLLELPDPLGLSLKYAMT